MRLDEFQKISIERFRGLYKRGMPDECPPDHAICCENVIFPKPGEVNTRDGTKLSLALNHPVKTMFLAANAGGLRFLSLDFHGNVYDGTNTTPIFTAPTMTDMACLNMFNKTFILPIASSYPPPHLQVWTGVSPVRNAAGLAPTSTFSAADGAADLSGGLDIGIHKFAIAFVTDTGFVTQPGPKISGTFTPVSYTAPGQKKVDLSGIPLGGSEVVARWILVTRANEELYFFAPGGFINDNTSTTLTLDFFDSDLAIDADYLFDLMETIPGVVGAGALSKYHGRQFITPVSIINPTGPPSNNLVIVSNSGSAESFNLVTGFILPPDENDGNQVFGLCILNDILYMTKFPGIFSTEDNGTDNPSSWPITVVDGGIGTYQKGISTITGSQPSLSKDNIFFLADRAGLYLFSGTVVQPELTWKIHDVWHTITHGYEKNIHIVVDIYSDIVYALLPTNGSMLPNLLLMGDYSEGLDAQNIKWAMFFFPFTPISAAMINFADKDGFSDYDYYLRLGDANNNLYKLEPSATDDVGAVITSYYQNGHVTAEKGAVNVTRALRFRARGTGNLDLSLYPEDLQSVVTPPSLTMSNFPGKELLRQTNFMNEKCSVKFSTTGKMNVNRLDVYMKPLFADRPQ